MNAKSATKHVYLFDIDGTLINAAGVGSRTFRAAVKAILNHELAWAQRDFAGMTDAGLAARAIAESGKNTQRQIFDLFFEEYHSQLELNLRMQPAQILPGVESLLPILAGDREVQLGLLTGNTQHAGRLKIPAIQNYFGLGFFGESHTERTKLGHHAGQEIRKRYGADVEITIIGDTPQDIECARAAGASCVAVATGLYGIDELNAADRVLHDLTYW
jgi:phosphoglycolate phosphatase